MDKETGSTTSQDIIGTTEQKAKDILTVLWNDLPTWLQDNHYIHSGYRPPSNSYSKSAASLGYLHNESVNIWTHLVGAILAIIAASTMYVSIRPRFEMATSEDVMAFSCFVSCSREQTLKIDVLTLTLMQFVGAIVCLGMSATYHAISNHSQAVAKFGNRLDYMGIVFLIWGSFIPSIFYGFSSEPTLVRLYWTMVCS